MEPLRIFVMQRMVEFADAEIVESLDSEPLFTRRENYDVETIPNGVLVLTAGIDVQEDRLEVTVDGWGKGAENWGVAHRILVGKTTEPYVWDEVDAYLETIFHRQDGTYLTISSAGFDTGNTPNDVYKFVKPRQSKKFYALKGSSIPNKPIVSRPQKSGVERVRLFMVGTDTAKTRIYARLRMVHRPDAPNPGYIHFPNSDDFDEVYFRQLTSEKVVVKIKGSDRIKAFEKHGRNEALDCKVYALAALMILNPNFDRLAKGERPARQEESPNDDIDNLPEDNDAPDSRETPSPDRENYSRPSRLPFRRRQGGWMR